MFGGHQRQRLVAVGALAHDHHPGLAFEHATDPFADHGVIVNDGDSDLRHAVVLRQRRG